ncbi:hypothetical protein HKX42_08165 [Salinisphaera sp. USBA-960]|uniref:hypothetical protein n=1 Tax=Salinisphaera orenii TaxID=856731 RepID=UPI000DBE9889|nr:hypothetical protein [Salifodinibacter halophilus]NNC26847.1 hypothetical protein [Salifodinibacter halophilus]
MDIVFRCDPNLEAHVPQPQPARSALPDWLRSMPANAHSSLLDQPIRTVKQCPPFLDAMQYGFMMPLPCDIDVRDGVFSWDWPVPEPAAAQHPRAPLSFHVPAQVEGSPMARDGQVVVKFNSFWTVELPAGWSLLAMPPANRDDLPFRPLTGLVDADQYHDVGILFPAVWTDPNFEGRLERGTPVVQCIPVPRQSFNLRCETMDADQTAEFDRLGRSLTTETGVYRRAYRARRSNDESS